MRKGGASDKGKCEGRAKIRWSKSEIENLADEREFSGFGFRIWRKGFRQHQVEPFMGIWQHAEAGNFAASSSIFVDFFAKNGWL